jgi:hypothetical protein
MYVRTLCRNSPNALFIHGRKARASVEQLSRWSPHEEREAVSCLHLTLSAHEQQARRYVAMKVGLRLDEEREESEEQRTHRAIGEMPRPMKPLLDQDARNTFAKKLKLA